MLHYFAGFAAAVLTGLGVGSGGLLVLYLTSVTHTPQLDAQMTNLLFFILASSLATIWNIRRKRIYYPALCLLSATAILGIIPGTLISLYISQSLLRKCFGGLLSLLGLIQLCKNKKK
ncbi:MAG TPA: hypothetical protein DCY74_00470 [Clostridiales bacterium]|jgi:uncharacterized membrane protein YfcA|nr:hypothetical protein [Clostridiales bacterium]HCG36528.1 hypothetical protein [Clostridiales bacterium]